MGFFSRTKVPNLLSLSLMVIRPLLGSFSQSYRVLWKRLTVLSQSNTTSASFLRPMVNIFFQLKLTKQYNFVFDFYFVTGLSTMYGFSGRGILTVKCLTWSKYILKGSDCEHSQQTRGFQEIIKAAFIFRGLMSLLNHYWIHFIWMNFAEPEHLQGAINGLFSYPYSRHTRQVGCSAPCCGSQPLEFYFVRLSYTLYWDLTCIFASAELSSNMIYLTFIF